MPSFKTPKWTNLYLFMHNELAQRANHLNGINLDTTNSDLVVSKWRFHSLTGGLEDSPSFAEPFCFPSELPAHGAGGARWHSSAETAFLPDFTPSGAPLWHNVFLNLVISSIQTANSFRSHGVLCSEAGPSLYPHKQFAVPSLCKIYIFGAQQE